MLYLAIDQYSKQITVFARNEEEDTVLSRQINFDLVRDFLHDEALGGEEKVLAKYLKQDLLIVDDMGMKNLPLPINTMLINRPR
jgi:hypothetical protein